MSEEFESRNEMEKSLLAAQEEKISSEDLLNILMGSPVFMSVQDEKLSLLNIQRSARAQPLVLFSSPERAKEFISDYPGFGIALNPGLDVGFDMEPETVNDLVDSLGQKARH